MIFGGSKDYSMRVWLNPNQMAAYNLTPKEVIASIQDKSLEAAPGKFGESSAESFEYVIKYKGKLNKPIDYENIVIRSNSDGSMLRLKDVAKIELGAYTYGNYTRVDGKPGINIAIVPAGRIEFSSMIWISIWNSILPTTCVQDFIPARTPRTPHRIQ